LRPGMLYDQRAWESPLYGEQGIGAALCGRPCAHDQSGELYRLSIVAAAKQLVGAVVNALMDELHGPIGHQEVGPAAVMRLESPGHAPVLVVAVRNGTAVAAGIVVIAQVVDGNNCGHVSIAAVLARPVVLSQVIEIGRAHV